MKRPLWVDAQQMHDLHPRTFEAPDAGELAAIKPGDNVKVSTGGERFWVLVVRHAGNKIVGTVDNNLICTDKHGLIYGDEVELEERHVYSVIGETA